MEHQTGRLFAPGDADAIVAAIRETTLKDLQTYGERGYERYRQLYTAERMNQRVWELYEEVLGESR